MPIGPSTSTAPYIVPTDANVRFTSILTAGDALPGDGVFAGEPDGLCAFDNGDGTITILVSHQLTAGKGIVRDHGSTGSYIDRIVVDKATLQVVSADDLIKSVQVWNDANDHYVTGTTAFRSFACAEVADQTAFYNAGSSLGTQSHILLTGEEGGSGTGRAYAVMVDGPQAGVAFELPYLGNMNVEAIMANPVAQDMTLLAITDDSVGGQVYFYIGQKQATGTDIEKAGLTGGDFYGLKVSGFANEVNGTPVSGSFTLQEIGPGGDVSNMGGGAIQSESVAEGVTGFLRPEDCAWDPDNPNVLYFVTTNSFTGNSRLYQATFTDINNPQLGGTIVAVLDGSEGQHMFDNIEISGGKIILQEDAGDNSYVSKIWQYDIATDTLTELAAFDPAKFTPGSPGYITQYEESSGVLDVTALLGDSNTRAYLVDAQLHVATGDPATYQKGQLMVMYVDDPAPPPDDHPATGTLAVSGTAEEGGSLTADLTGVSDPDGATTTGYQWQHFVPGAGPDILNGASGTWTNTSGANSATFNVPADQSFVGVSVRVVATTTDTAGGTTKFTGDPQAIANVDDAATGTLGVTGAAAEGSTLTAALTSVSDPDGATTMGYQWQHFVAGAGPDTLNGASGAWTDISGANSDTFNVPAGYNGESVRVVATTTDTLGGTTTFLGDPKTIGNTVNGIPGAPADSDTAAANQLQENAVAGAYTGVTWHSTDPDGQAVTYTLTDDAGGRFSVDSTTGRVVATGTTPLDYETALVDGSGNHYYDIAVTASDGTDSSAASTVRIYVTNQVENVFTAGNDGSQAVPVNFNTMPDGKYDFTDARYNAFAGDDWVILPNSSSVDAGNPWDYAKTFTAGKGNDRIQGGTGADIINGGDGNDWLFGGAGNDTLIGGVGKDIISSGVGADKMTGSSGADIFVFNDSALGTAKSGPHDVITDFLAGTDKLDLSMLYSAHAMGTIVAGNASAGAAVSNYGLVYNISGGKTYVYGDTNGVAGADFVIELSNSVTLSGADVISTPSQWSTAAPGVDYGTLHNDLLWT
jgi:hypothetical protein